MSPEASQNAGPVAGNATIGHNPSIGHWVKPWLSVLSGFCGEETAAKEADP
jgi:hypothetical protein